jgi:hypothetical protein
MFAIVFCVTLDYFKILMAASILDEAKLKRLFPSLPVVEGGISKVGCGFIENVVQGPTRMGYERQHKPSLDILSQKLVKCLHGWMPLFAPFPMKPESLTARHSLMILSLMIA